MPPRLLPVVSRHQNSRPRQVKASLDFKPRWIARGSTGGQRVTGAIDGEGVAQRRFHLAEVGRMLEQSPFFLPERRPVAATAPI